MSISDQSLHYQYDSVKTSYTLIQVTYLAQRSSESMSFVMTKPTMGGAKLAVNFMFVASPVHVPDPTTPGALISPVARF